MLTSEDKQHAAQLLMQVSDSLTEVVSMATELNNMMKRGDMSHSTKGLSFLEVKNNLMLSYMINMTHLMGEKLRGKSICESPDVDRLVEIRTVLEKMRPIDQKLKYQIERLVRTAKMGVIADDDPMRLKPNIDNLADDSNDENGSGDEDQKSKQIYKPTKLVPVYYDGDESAKQKKERQLETVKKRLAKSAAIRELHREYTDAPEEIRETSDVHRLKEDRLGQERKEYEEKYFIRMSATKKDKAAARQMHTMSGLDGITKFGDMNFLTGRGNAGGGKKRKKESGGKKHKSSSAKRRKFRK